MKQLVSAPLSINTWQCPACLNKCTCVRCRKERDEIEGVNGASSTLASISTPNTVASISMLASVVTATRSVTEAANAPTASTSTVASSATDITTPTSVSTSSTNSPNDPTALSALSASSVSGTIAPTATALALPIVAVKKEPGVTPTLAVSILTASEQSLPPPSAFHAANFSPTTPPGSSLALTPNTIVLEPVERCVYILRGLPGSGKSFLTSHLIGQANHRAATSMVPQTRPPSCVCSADFFFVDPITGNYNFDSRRLGEAHAYCLTTFLQALASGIPCIVVDNTNSGLWEYRNYQLCAAMLGYPCIVYEVMCDSETMLRAMWQRHTHQVPFHAQLSMFQRFEADMNSRKIQPLFTNDSTIPPLNASQSTTDSAITPASSPPPLQPMTSSASLHFGASIGSAFSAPNSR
jgi:hypothetical protein